MTDTERRRGLAFLLLYLFVFPYFNGWAQRLLFSDAESMPAEANVVYYGFLFVLVLLVFWGFLKEDFLGLLDWLPENLFSLAAGLLLAGGFRVALHLLPLHIFDPMAGQYAAEFAAAPGPTLVLLLVLIPVVEELVYRGIVYGTLRSYSPALAGVAATILYALANVWRYALELGDVRVLLLAFLYLPKGAALTWCYDNGGSIWACALCHAAINGVTLFLAV